MAGRPQPTGSPRSSASPRRAAVAATSTKSPRHRVIESLRPAADNANHSSGDDTDNASTSSAVTSPKQRERKQRKRRRGSHTSAATGRSRRTISTKRKPRGSPRQARGRSKSPRHRRGAATDRKQQRKSRASSRSVSKSKSRSRSNSTRGSGHSSRSRSHSSTRSRSSRKSPRRSTTRGRRSVKSKSPRRQRRAQRDGASPRAVPLVVANVEVAHGEEAAAQASRHAGFWPNLMRRLRGSVDAVRPMGHKGAVTAVVVTDNSFHSLPATNPAAQVTGVRLGPERWVFSAASDGSLLRWDAATSQCAMAYHVNRRAAIRAAGHIVGAAVRDQESTKLLMWQSACPNAAARPRISHIAVSSCAPRWAAAATEGRPVLYASAGDFPVVYCFDAASGQLLEVLSIHHASPVETFTVLNSRSSLLVGTWLFAPVLLPLL